MNFGRPTHPGGRPPKYPQEGGRQQPFTVYLTPAMQSAVLAHGRTVSEAVNRILRRHLMNQPQTPVNPSK